MLCYGAEYMRVAHIHVAPLPGGEKAVKIAEILAKNAVHAVEQVAAETGYKGDEKLEQARDKVRAELTKYNISMTDKDLDTFVESAVKQMNDAWKGQE